MGKKHTQEYAEQVFRDGGCELLGEYINARTPVEYKCSCGNASKISLGNFQKGERCWECRNRKNGDRFRHKQEYVEQIFTDGSCKLLDKYKNNSTPMTYKCECGNIAKISLSNFQKGKRCMKCSGTEKHTNEYVQKFFKDHDCEALDEYINCRTPMTYKCECGNIAKIKFNHFRDGHRCTYCVNNNKKTIEFVRNEFTKKGAVLLSSVYINNHTKLDYICKNGHRHSITLADWVCGKGCPICRNNKLSIRRQGAGNPNWKNYSEKDLKKLFNYRMNVRQLTNNNYRKYKSVINPFNLQRKRNKYHLDHIYSIIDGFNNDVPPEIISHPNNLQMLLKYDNLSKNNKSDISLEELYNRYSYWEAENVL